MKKKHLEFYMPVTGRNRNENVLLKSSNYSGDCLQLGTGFPSQLWKFWKMECETEKMSEGSVSAEVKVSISILKISRTKFFLILP